MKRQSGRIKVLVVDDPKMDGVGWWRNSEPFTALDQMYGDQLEILQRGENVSIHELKTVDVVVRFRPITKSAFEFLALCKSMGKKIIIDLDDDLWRIPRTHPGYDEWEANKENMNMIYELADKIWVSTEQLRYVVGDLDKCEVMQNAILPDQLPDAPMEWKSIAAWRGNSSQAGDILSFEAHEAYYKARNLYDRWIFAGYFPALRHKENVGRVRAVSPLAYFLSLSRGFANVIWKPLQENEFNNSKSNIAWIEATMSGGVCVTNYAGKPGWELCFSDFPTDPEVIAKKWQESKREILENYNLLTVSKKRFESIISLVI